MCLYGGGRVFTGDTLFQGSIFSKLLTLPEETVVLPGHVMQGTIGEEKRSNPFLRRDMGMS